MKRTVAHVAPTELRRLALGATARGAAATHLAGCATCSSEVSLLRLLAATREGAPAPCPEAEDLVLRAQGRLEARAAATVDAHVRTCRDCAADLESLARTLAATMPKARSSPSRTRQRLSDLAARLKSLATFEMPPCLALATRRPGATSDTATKALEAYRDGRLAAARKLLESAVAARGAPPELRHFLAACLVKDGEVDAAREQLERLVKARPRMAEYRWGLAQVLLALGEGEQAAAQLERVASTPGSRRAAARAQLDAVRRLNEA